jgi:hypothetical protein
MEGPVTGKEPDFDTGLLSQVMHTYNLDDNFIAVHGPFIEGMLANIDAPYSNEELTPEECHSLRVRCLHTFIKRAYQQGRNDGLVTACSRVAGQITGGFHVGRHLP